MKRYNSLHVLRGLAALSVALLHLPRTWANFPVSFYGLENTGYAGVYLFFVLSGFLMVHLHAEAGRTGLDVAWNFLRRRLERTVPPYWAALAFAMVVYGTIPEAARCMDVVPPFTGEYILANMLAVDQHLLPVSWTLAYEWRFYAVFAVWCMLLPLPPWSLAVAWFGLLLMQGGQHPFGYMSSNIFGLLVGVLAGEWFRRRPRADFLPLAIAGLAWTIVFTRFSTMNYGELIYPIFLAPVVLAAAQYDVAQRPRYNPVWLWLGDYSYVLYLIHVPCYYLAMHILGWSIT